MKFRIQARLCLNCLAIYDFEARIMLSLCLTFQRNKSEKFNSNVAAKSEYIFNDFY